MTGRTAYPRPSSWATYSYSTFRRLSPATCPGVTDYLTGHADALPASVMSELEPRRAAPRARAHGGRRAMGLRRSPPDRGPGRGRVQGGAPGGDRAARGAGPTGEECGARPGAGRGSGSRATELVEFLSVSEGGADLLARRPRRIDGWRR